MRDRVRYHSPALIEKLLEWCEANALARARAVVAIGLAYIYGLNEHQIAAARLAPKDTAVTITYPLARREAEIDNAEFGTLVLDTPEWLGEAAAHLTAGSNTGQLLYRPQNRMQIPVRATVIRKLVADAAAEATGVRMTVATLVSSRTVAAQRVGTPLALHGIGYAPTWSARLAVASPSLILPRKAP